MKNVFVLQDATIQKHSVAKKSPIKEPYRMIGMEWCFSVTSVYIYDSGSFVPKIFRRLLTVSLKRRVKLATGCRPFIPSYGGSLTSITDRPCAI